MRIAGAEIAFDDNNPTALIFQLSRILILSLQTVD